MMVIMGKIVVKKKSSRYERERAVLFGLIELFLLEGKPVGSNTLKENGFDHLSSATIRNYFAKLEMDGYLLQHHASGGRVPTNKAYRLYAETKRCSHYVHKNDHLFLSSILDRETKEISVYLQEAVEAITEITGCPVVISAPRFDQDFVVDVKLLKLDEKRALCAIMTDFSLVHTEIIYLPTLKKGSLSVDKLEAYFCHRLKGDKRPKMRPDEQQFAQKIYNELILRHFVAYTNMESEDLYRGGFSKLLAHPEFHDPSRLSNALSLLESRGKMRFILKECFNEDRLKFWIGDDLQAYVTEPGEYALIATPYRLHTKVVGTIAILGPNRLPYEKVFGVLHEAARLISQNLTNSMYKYKLSYRQPETKVIQEGPARDKVLSLPEQSLIIEKHYDRESS